MVVKRIQKKVLEDEWPIWSFPLTLFGLVLVSCVGFLFFYFGPSVEAYRGLKPSPTTSMEKVGVEVSGTLFVMPASFTRYATHRGSQRQDNVSLHAILPELAPYTADTATEFLRTDAQSPLVLINLVEAGEQYNPERHLQEFLRPAANATPLPAPTGLTGYNFKADASYAGRQLFIAEASLGQSARAFICEHPSAASPDCESRFRIGPTVMASYVFKRAHLNDWRDIERDVGLLLKSFRANALKFRH